MDCRPPFLANFTERSGASSACDQLRCACSWRGSGKLKLPTSRFPSWVGRICHPLTQHPRTYSLGKIARTDVPLWLCRGAIRDKEVELERPPERTVSEKRIYSWTDWDRHRSTSRYFRHIAALPLSSIAWGLRWPMAWVCFVALLVGSYETLTDMDVLPVHLPHLTVIYRPFEVTNFALALLLVFRTDASYARWQAARDNWKSVITHSREIMRLGCEYFHGRNRMRLDQLCRWICAYAWCLRDHLLQGQTLRESLTGLLTQREIDVLMDNSLENKPMQVLAIISQLINRVSTDPTLRGAMLESVARLEETLADCERILKTPIPRSYTRHTSRFIIAYLTFLPLAMWDETSWGVVPTSGIVAFFLLGIDEIGVQIEEPFSIMPLERYCQTIQEDSFAAKRMHSTAMELLSMSEEPDGLSGLATTALFEQFRQNGN